ncbi:MAG: radical SAM protein [Candidatus Omnitrophota bacterium]
MKEISYDDFRNAFGVSDKRAPLYGQINLTYKCHFNCIHCYCAGQPKEELKPLFWKEIIDQVRGLGGIEITFTGGDPLLYQGFLEVYRYAREKGFLVNIFTSGFNINEEVLECLEKNPPLNIEITLNSLNKDNYERITRRENSFDTVIRNIHEIKRRSLPLVLKCNGLKENKDEIINIKRFTEKLLGKGKFKFDSFIFPGLNGAEEPKRHRLEPEDIIKIESSDSDMRAQRQEEFRHRQIWFNPEGLYHCNSWFDHYFINPQGILQFCYLTKECSTDLRKEAFKDGFDRFAEILKLKYKTDSKCIGCRSKEHCHKCPARSLLETGEAESPVEYYCRLAEARRD